MKNPKPDYLKGIVGVLVQLKLKYPKYTIGRHLSAAFCEHGDTWGLSDREFYRALSKYYVELEGTDTSDEELTKIIIEGMNLDTILDDQAEEELIN